MFFARRRYLPFGLMLIGQRHQIRHHLNGGVLIRSGLFREETRKDEKTKQLKMKDSNGGCAGTRTPDLLRVKKR
jgi:hypothetical protein